MIVSNLRAKADNEVVITSPSQGESLTSANPLIAGTATPNKFINIRIDDTYVARVQANNNGNWSYQAQNLSNASHSVQASITDGSAAFGSQLSHTNFVKTDINNPILSGINSNPAKMTSPFKTVFNADNTRAYVADNVSQKVNVIDTNSKEILNTVTLSGQAQDIVYSQSRNKLYIPTGDNQNIDVIDTTNIQSYASSFPIDMATGKMTLSSDNSTYYNICGGGSYVCVGTLEQHGHDWRGNWDSSIKQVQEISYDLLMVATTSSVYTYRPSDNVILSQVGISGNIWNNTSPDDKSVFPISWYGQKIAIPNANTGNLDIYDTDLNYVLSVPSIGQGPYSISQYGDDLYIYCAGDKRITKVSIGNMGVISYSPTITYGTTFTGMQIHDNGVADKIYVTSQANPPNIATAQVEVYDPMNNVITQTVQLDNTYTSYPYMQPNGNQLWLASPTAAQVRVLDATDNSNPITNTIYASPNAGNIFVSDHTQQYYYTNGDSPYDYGRIRKIGGNAQAGQEVNQVEIGGPGLASFKLSIDDSRIIAYNRDTKEFFRINPANLSIESSFNQDFDCATNTYDINSDGSKIYCGDGNGNVRVYNSSDGSTIATYDLNDGHGAVSNSAVRVSPDGNFIFLANGYWVVKYDVVNNTATSTATNPIIRDGIGENEVTRNLMSLNPQATKLYIGGGAKMEIFDVGAATPTSIKLLDAAPANPRHDLVFSQDGKRAFMAYAAPVNSLPGVVYAQFDTVNDLFIGIQGLEYTSITGATIALSNNVTAVESTTITFSVNQPVIFTGDGNFQFSKNVGPYYVAAPTQYALGPMSVNVTNGSLPDGMSLIMCYDGTSYPCFTGIPTTVGTYNISAEISDGITSSTKNFNLVVDNGIEFQTQSPIQSGVIGQAYNYDIRVQHNFGATTIGLLSGDLPLGLSLNQVSNEIINLSGTIDQNQPLQGVCFTLAANDNYNSTQKEFCMNMNSTPQSWETNSLADGTFSTAYSQILVATGGELPRTFSITNGTLPSGLNLNSDTGEISGTPTSSGVSVFTARSTDRTGSIDREFTINIDSGVNPNATISTPTLQKGRINVEYNQNTNTQVAATGFLGNVAWSVVSGNLPPGISFYQEGQQNGNFAGIPTQAGVFTFTLAASDGLNSRTKEYSLRIEATPPEPARTSVVITSPSNGSSLGGGTQMVTGTASPAGSTIQLSIDGQNPYDVQVGSDGKWSFEATNLTSGAHSFKASIKQAAREYAYVANVMTGDISIINTATDLVVGTIKPPAPSNAPGDHYFFGSVEINPDGTKGYAFGAKINFQNGFDYTSVIYEIDLLTNSFERKYELANTQLSSINIDKQGSYAYLTGQTQSGIKKIYKIDLQSMQTTAEKTEPNLGDVSQELPFKIGTISDDGSKVFLPNPGSDFVNIINTNDLSTTQVDVGRPTMQVIYFQDNKLAALPFTATATINPVTTYLNNSGQATGTYTSDTQGTPVVFTGALTDSARQYGISRVRVETNPGQYLNFVSIVDTATFQPVGQVQIRDWGFGMAATKNAGALAGGKLFVTNFNNGGWGNVDVIQNPTGLLAGSKYPIQTGGFTENVGSNWIAATPLHTFEATRSVTIYGGAAGAPGTTSYSMLPQFKIPSFNLTVIKPFTMPSFNFSPNLNLPNLAPLIGLQNKSSDQSSKTNAGFLGNAFGALKTSVSLVPTKVALAFPYLLLLVLIVMILSLLVQTRDELEKAHEIKHIMARRKSLEDERNNFVSLISHYLNTPISMMQGGVDLIATLQRAPKSMTDSLQKTLTSVGQKVKSLLTSTSQTSNAKPDETKIPLTIQPYKSFAVMAPVILVATMTAATNWIFNSAGVIDISIINIFTQILAFGLLMQALFSTYRHHQKAKHSLAVAQNALDNEMVMAQARLHFLSGSVGELKAEVAGLRRNLPGLAAAPNAKAVKDGYARLQSILGRLQLLTEIEQDQHRGDISDFSLRRAIENVVSQYKPQLATKKIKLELDIPKSLHVHQDRQMLELVVSSLIDNAIKFSPKEDGLIRIASEVNKGKVSLVVVDNGTGIAKNKLTQLFKPFSRAESALRFNYEGLGLSLYLDKVIIEKLGGTIDIESSKGNGTKVTIKLTPKLRSPKNS